MLTYPTRMSRRRRRSPLRRLPVLMGAVCVTSSLAGCSVASASGPSTSVIAEADWPARITAGLEELAARTPPFLVDKDGRRSYSVEPSQIEETNASVHRVVSSVACGQGVVLEWGHQRPGTSEHHTTETTFAFVSFSPMTPEGQRLEPGRQQLPAEISWEHVCAGVGWTLYEPKDGPPHGLVVHLGGNKYVRRALLKHGWAVLHSSGSGRFTQRRAAPPVFEIERGEQLNETAARIAAIFDDELADWPYALEAMLEYLSERRPDLPQRPAAIMGFSIGALGLPAVVARMPGRFQAAVIVAGGANLLEISQRSHKPDPGIKLKWRGAPPTREDWQNLYAAYLERAKLDPYHSAAALAETPVLVYQAYFDQVVPAETGGLLYKRLGEPQRFALPVGHRHLLRIIMRLEAGRIVEWTEAAISKLTAH